MTSREMLAIAVMVVPAATAGALWLIPAGWVKRCAVTGAIATSGLACLLAGALLWDLSHPELSWWLALDAGAGLLIGIVGLVGLVAVLTSPTYLNTSGASPGRGVTYYYCTLYLFWTVLFAVPMAGNLGLALLLVGTTTITSALLVGFSATPRALEAAWKYLILTSLGIGVALLGLVVLATEMPGGGLDALAWQALPSHTSSTQTAVLAYLLIMVGLATKVGLAPVHHWLPDAHSEAPAPVSALLSSALLPAVLVVAWRSSRGMAPVIGTTVAHGVLIAFGLVSISFAVPFLARPLGWKRLMAYSSIKHMGVVALGLGLATPLALAGVAIHLVAHAIVKTLGFTAATPLLVHQPSAATVAACGIGRSQRTLATSMAISLGTLSGLPPLPLFVSELLIIAGGFQSRWPWIAVLATVLLALTFLGLMRALIETTLGDSVTSGAARPAGLSGVAALAVVSVLLLLTLSGMSAWLISTDAAQDLLKGLL